MTNTNTNTNESDKPVMWLDGNYKYTNDRNLNFLENHEKILDYINTIMKEESSFQKECFLNEWLQKEDTLSLYYQQIKETFPISEKVYQNHYERFVYQLNITCNGINSQVETLLGENSPVKKSLSQSVFVTDQSLDNMTIRDQLNLVFRALAKKPKAGKINLLKFPRCFRWSTSYITEISAQSILFLN